MTRTHLANPETWAGGVQPLPGSWAPPPMAQAQEVLCTACWGYLVRSGAPGENTADLSLTPSERPALIKRSQLILASRSAEGSAQHTAADPKPAVCPLGYHPLLLSPVSFHGDVTSRTALLPRIPVWKMRGGQARLSSDMCPLATWGTTGSPLRGQPLSSSTQVWNP